MKRGFGVCEATAAFLGAAVASKAWGLVRHDAPLDGVGVVGWFGEDAAVALLLAVFLVVVVGPVRRRLPRVGRVLPATIAVGLVLFTAINAAVVSELGTPLTPAMLRGAGSALDDSIAGAVSVGSLLSMVVVVAGAGLAVAGVRRFATPTATAVALSALLVIAVVAPTLPSPAHRSALHRNAIAALWIPSDRMPSCAPSTVGAEKNAIRATELSEARDLRSLSGIARDRDVLFLILESTAPEALPFAARVALSDDATDPTPNLTALAKRSLVFENAYATYPESVKGLTALLMSHAPAIDTPVEAYHDRELATLPAAFASAGYRTALFHSGRFDYLGMRGIVEGRGYETLEDASAIGGEVESSFGVSDRETAARVLTYFDSLSPGERAFVTYMPISGHHPYDSPEAGPFTGSEEWDSYRNALHYGDRALGDLLDGLEARGRLDDTLIVAVGDHGQAFRRHVGNYGHTFYLYEENVHVPLVIALPGSDEMATRIPRPVSHLDVAPTVLDLCGLPALPAFEGESLLEPTPRAALFFTDYALPLVGLRDGDWKFVHTLDAGVSELYDLRVDPWEREDVSGEQPERVERYERRCVEWLRRQSEQLTDGSARSLRGATARGR